MNRREEYRILLQDLENAAPDLGDSLEKARERRSRNRRLRPLTGIAACFALFVLLVNVSPPVAHACSRVPVLRELAEAVTFSHSLSEAVENEFVQPMELEQTQNGVTARVEYLIVDQKQVNVFYRLDSDVYSALLADPIVRHTDGSHARCSYGNNSYEPENGALRSMTIDFYEEDVPPALKLTLNVWDQIPTNGEPPEMVRAEDTLFEDYQPETNYLAEFDFILEFDPAFTAAGTHYDVNQTVELDGQKITVTSMDVYPTQLRITIEEYPDNTAHVQHLSFRIEAEPDWRFDPITNGITAIGSLESPLVTTYMADSSYFHEAEHLRLVITGAEFLSKDRERLYVNLAAGETGPLPEGVRFHSAVQQRNGWLLRFHADYRAENSFHQIFDSQYYDPSGTEHMINAWSSYFGDDDMPLNEKTVSGTGSYFVEEFALRDYPYDEVWLFPHYSHVWTAEQEIVVPLS